MRSFQKEVVISLARREHTDTVAQVGKGPRHVESGPNRNPIAEVPGKVSRVIGEIFCEVSVGPAAPFFEGLREVPVIQGAERAYTSFQKRIHQTAVVIHAFLVDGSRSGGLNPGPRN